MVLDLACSDDRDAVAVTLIVSRQQFRKSTFQTSEMGPERPSDVGLDYEASNIEIGDRTLRAWWVPAENAVGAVLVFHGQNEALSDWVPAIARLNDNDLSVFVFDYSGFGESEGDPSVQTLREDSEAAFKVFQKRAPDGPIYLLGYSLGAGVLIDAMNHHDLTSDAIVLASPFSSIRDVAVEEGAVPGFLSAVVPDAYNNVTGARSINVAMRIVHSETDGRFRVQMAQEVAEAAPNAEIVIVPTPRHSEFLASPDEIGDSADRFWSAVLEAMTRQP